jgi:hypothetical protein
VQGLAPVMALEEGETLGVGGRGVGGVGVMGGGEGVD